MSIKRSTVSALSCVTNLVLIHIGKNLPDFIYDCIYQCLLINKYNSKIYVVIDDSVINDFNKTISQFDFNIYMNSPFHYENIIQIVPLSILEKRSNENFEQYKEMITKFGNLSEFRDGFWVSTTARFYYISILMDLFKLENVFHIENDIMMYETFNDLYDVIKCKFNLKKVDQICMVQDAPGRVIPSLLFFPDCLTISNLTSFMTNTFKQSNQFMNDMNLLGMFQDKFDLPTDPEKIYTDKNRSLKFIFDGAAFGQYLGGVDFKNLPNSDNLLVQYDNPSRGFINETAVVKPNAFGYIKKNVVFDHLCVPIKIPLCGKVENNELGTMVKIANLHVHSKQLNQFSSINDILYRDIITGDRVINLCDFVLLTRDIYEFHQNIDKYARDVIIIKDFKNIRIELLNSHFKTFCNKKNTKVIKLFIYTHILDNFMNYILPFLDTSIEYILYIHNSDHCFDNNYKALVDSKIIKKIYAQNIDYSETTTKLNLLPIGIANSMWKHGDLLELYSVIKDVYRNKKQNGIYVNINPNTYSYRKILLEKIQELGNFNLSSSKSYIDYLKELASHRFCLCIRGNGLDTHRFWESLYLGVIPVIINNKTTECDNFIRYLVKLDLPFYEIKHDDLNKMFTQYTRDFFTEELYKKIIKDCNSSMYNLNSLKLSNYI